MLDDHELLQCFVTDSSEAAFGELVARYVNLVYSVALRRTGGDIHLAQDVAQLVFTDLARKARRLPPTVVLAGWLHRATRYAAAQMLRTERRRARREQEALAMNTLESETSPDWERFRPLLDAALDDLGREDRDALLLRFFEQRSLAEVGDALGANEDAARKRVSRALEKLRAHLNRRGVTTTVVALATTIPVHAVQTAPAGLAAMLASAACAGAAATAGAGTGFTLLKLMATTTFKVTTICALVTASVVTPLALYHQTQMRLRDLDAVLQLGAEQLASLRAENERLANFPASITNPRWLPEAEFGELLRLRGEVGRLRTAVRELMQTKATDSAPGSNDLAAAETLWAERVSQLKQWLAANPAEAIPELQLLTDGDWLNSIYPLTLATPDEYSRALSSLRASAEDQILNKLGGALRRYAVGNSPVTPTELSQLTAYLEAPIAEAILQRYELVPATNLVSELQGFGDWVITQKAPVNAELDVRFVYSLTGGSMADGRITNRWVQHH